MVARNVTAILIALLVLILGVRPLAKALLKKRDEAGVRAALGRPIGNPQGGGDGGARGGEVSIDMLEGSRGYADRVGLVRRSEARRVGKASVSTCKSRGGPVH